jgi:hypothetical protein
LAELDEQAPYLTEREMIARGALYQKADQPWVALAVEEVESSRDRIPRRAVQ